MTSSIFCCYKTPILRFLLPYIFGIVSCVFFDNNLKTTGLLILGGIAMIFFVLGKIQWQQMCVQLCCFGLGLFACSTPPELIVSSKKREVLKGPMALLEIKKQNREQVNFITRVNDVKCMVYLKKKHLFFFPNDTLLVQGCTIKYIQKNELKNPYLQYLVNKDIRGQIFLKEANIVTVYAGNGLVRKAYQIRQKIIHKIQQENVFSPVEEGIFFSLILGEKSYLDNDTKEEFRQSGIIHVLAISGLHVGIFFFFLQKILQFMQIHQRTFKFIFVVSALLCYCLIAGLSPSIVRACLMCSLLQLGWLLEEKNLLMNIVLSSALLVLIFKPMWIWDIGFQLSYGAVIAIVYGLEQTKGLILKIKRTAFKKITQLFLVNGLAFVGTTPILLYHFQLIYWGGLLASLLVVPLISIVVIVGICTLFFVPFSALLHPCLLLNQLLMQLLGQLALLFSTHLSLPSSISINGATVLLLYLIFFVVLNLKISYINKIKLLALSSLLLIITTC